MLTTFSFGVSSNLSQQKSPTVEIIGIYFLGTIVPRKYMPIISAIGLFCYDKFEETSNEKVVNMSKLTKSYFSNYSLESISKKFDISMQYTTSTGHIFGREVSTNSINLSVKSYKKSLETFLIIYSQLTIFENI